MERSAEADGRALAAAIDTEAAVVLTGELAPLGPATPVAKLYLAVDGTGVPAVPADTDGRAGKDPDGRAHTREVKLGVAFTQTSVDEQGFPIRNPHSSSYVATFEPVEHFGALVYAEARRRGSAKANEVVVLGDGAVWIWNLANLHFPGATHIVDLYHAREHLHDLGTLLAPVLGADRASCLADRSDELDAGDIPAILTAARALEVPAAKTDDLDKALGYFQNNAARMQYQTFSPSRPLRRLRRGRSQLQGRDRPTAQTVRDALERARRHRHRHPALPGSQRPLGRNLEAAPQPDQRGLTPPPTNLSHTRHGTPLCRGASPLTAPGCFCTAQGSTSTPQQTGPLSLVVAALLSPLPANVGKGVALIAMTAASPLLVAALTPLVAPVRRQRRMILAAIGPVNQQHA